MKAANDAVLSDVSAGCQVELKSDGSFWMKKSRTHRLCWQIGTQGPEVLTATVGLKRFGPTMLAFVQNVQRSPSRNPSFAKLHSLLGGFVKTMLRTPLNQTCAYQFIYVHAYLRERCAKSMLHPFMLRRFTLLLRTVSVRTCSSYNVICEHQPIRSDIAFPCFSKHFEKHACTAIRIYSMSRLK